MDRFHHAGSMPRAQMNWRRAAIPASAYPCLCALTRLHAGSRVKVGLS